MKDSEMGLKNMKKQTTALKAFFQELDLEYEKGGAREAEEFLRKTVDRYSRCAGGSEEVYIAALSELGGLYRGMGKYAESEKSLLLVQEKIAGRLGTDSMEYATNLNNLAGT